VPGGGARGAGGRPPARGPRRRRVENLTQGKKYGAEAFPPFMQELIDRGGLLEYVKSQLAEGSRS